MPVPVSWFNWGYLFSPEMQKNACIESMIPDSHNLISFEKHISVTIKHKLCLGLTESIFLIFRNTKGRDRTLGVSKVIIQF